MRRFCGKIFKVFSIICVVLVVFIILISVIDYYSTRVDRQEITYTKLLQEVDQQKVDRVTITDNLLLGKLKDGKEFKVMIPRDSSSLINTMQKKNIEIKFEQTPEPSWWRSILGIKEE